MEEVLDNTLQQLFSIAFTIHLTQAAMLYIDIQKQAWDLDITGLQIQHSVHKSTFKG